MLKSRPFASKWVPETPKEREARRAEVTRREMAQVRPRAAVVGGATTGPVPKAPKPVRDEPYRRLVAQLPCFQCRVEGHTQAAHPNAGKTHGVKLDDDKCFPMCTVSAKDCHGHYDRYELVKHDDMPAYERKAYVWTVLELVARGLWPMGRPIPDLRRFN